MGKLIVNVQADFLSSEGFGNIRYHSGKLQYFNVSSNEWVDIEATTDNKLAVNLSSQPMQKMNLAVDVENKCYKIIFKEPNDTVLDGQLLVAVDGIKFIRKLGSEPADVNDGILVLDYKRKEFSNYEHKVYSDKSFIPNNGENWFYKAFPYSTNGVISSSSMNVANTIFKDYYLYGFKIDQNESDPSSMISYLDDCDNTYFQPAHMDYALGKFNYGDWKDVWFIQKIKPCMLKYDGTVDYELNPNDYSKKINGTDSDIANPAYEGNVMVGIPKVYWKIVDNGDDTANIYISNKKVDDDFVCWSHIDNNDNEIDYCYMSAYNGCKINNRLRALSGVIPLSNTSAVSISSLVSANNLDNNNIWEFDTFSDRLLLILLTLMIGKSTDAQAVFGKGNCNSYNSPTKTGFVKSGTMDSKGLFWGSQDKKSGVKLFGIENLWGNVWRVITGVIGDHGTLKVKMTYGQSDGTTVDGYSFDGEGYTELFDFSSNVGYSSDCVRKMRFTEKGMFPEVLGGSTTTYYTDLIGYEDSGVNFLSMGGATSDGDYTGLFSLDLATLPTYVDWWIGAALSCKPFA